MSSVRYNVLVVDTISAQVLVGVKSLVRAGYSVHVATWSSRVKQLALLGLGVASVSSVPNPPASDFERAIKANIAKINPRVVLPFGFMAFTYLTQIRDILPLLPTVNAEKYKLVNNKLTFNHFLQGPEFYKPRRYQADEVSQCDTMKYPTVVKLAVGKGVELGVRYANNQAELERCISRFRKEGVAVDQLVIEEFVPGIVFDVAGVAWDGTVIDMLVQKRSVCLPISGGVGAINKTVLDEKLMALGKKIIKDVEYTGPFQIEVKKVGRQFFVVEFNPKFWGTLDLSIRSGKDFPADLVAKMLGYQVSRDESAYEKNLLYIFSVPQWIFARKQIQRKFGDRWSLATEYERKVTDFGTGGPIYSAFALVRGIGYSIRLHLRGRFGQDFNRLPDNLLLKGLEIEVLGKHSQKGKADL